MRAVRRASRRALDWVPLTPLGLLAGVGAAAALRWLAYRELDLVVLVVGYGALGVVGASVVLVAASAAGLELWLRTRGRRDPSRSEPRSARAETDRPARTGFSLPSLAWLPLLQLRWTWVQPPDARVQPRRVTWGRLHEEVTLARRGTVRRVQRRIELGDAFGFARMAIRHHEDRTLDVLPHTGALRRLPVRSSFAGGDERPHPMGLDDGDRVELRRYVPGDPARFIHWKVFGRTRRLMVRVPERALSHARRIVAYMVAGPHDEASAGAARAAIEEGALGSEWRFSADGARGHEASTPDEAVALLLRSREASAEQGAGELASFVERAERSGPAAVVVFAPAAEGPWTERVTSLARRHAGGVRVVIGVDGLAPQPERRWWERLVLQRTDALDATPAEPVDRITRTLAAGRCEVVVVDRVSGRVLVEGQRRVAGAQAGSARIEGRAA